MEAMQYYQLLTEQNAAVISLWPKTVAVFVLADAARLYFSSGCSAGHMFIFIAASMCCWGIYWAAQTRRNTLLRSLFIISGCCQMAFHLNYLRGKDSFPKVYLKLDFLMDLTAGAPQLVVGLTGLPIEAYILFIGGHVAASSLSYIHFAKMSWFFAVLRALGVQALTMLAALIVHKRARTLMHNTQMASQQHERQQLLQQESLSKGESAKQSSTTVAHPPLTTQIVSRPAISTQVVRHLLSLLRQRRSTLHTDSSLIPQGAQAGSACDREPQEGVKIAQQQAPHTQAEPGAQGKQQQQQQHAGVQAQAEPEVYQEQQQVKQANQQQQAQQQQQHSAGASGKGSSAAGQEQALSSQAGHTQQSASKCNVSNSLGRKEWTPSYPSAHQTHNTLVAPNPALQKAMAQAAQVLEHRRGQEDLYASKLYTQPSRQDQKKALQSVRQSCRLIVKLSGSATPDCIPEGGLAQLQHKLRKYQCLAPAVRAGCLVISCDASSVDLTCSLEEMKKAVLAEAKEWAQEQGLLEPGEDLLTVQACRSTYWDSAFDGQSSPAYSMAVHAPFLIPNPGGFTSASSTQKQQENDCAEMDNAMGKQGYTSNQAPECVQEQEALCEFELTIFAPEGEFELRGWQGAADAPEDLPDAVKSRSLCLLASLEGQFLGVTVKKESLKEWRSGEHVVQVCVSLPLDTCLSCPRPLMLELWAEGSLVCSYCAMFLPPSLPGAAALAELQDWAAGLTGTLSEGSSPFMRDLVQWMNFQADAQLQQQEQQQGMGAARDADLSDGAMQQQVELMTAVGMDLLECSLSSGMEGVAGLLLECFASFPFCIPPLELLGTLLAARPEDQPGAPPASTWHSSTHCNGSLLSCPTPPVPTPSTLTTDAPAAIHSSSLTRIMAAPSAVCRKLAAVARGLTSAQPSEEEADYHAWSNAQVAPLARLSCRLSLLHICGAALRTACAEGMPPLLALSSWGIILLGYAMGAFFIRPKGSPSSEIILAAIAIARAFHCIALGLGLIPMSAQNQLLLNWRVEVVSEVMVPMLEHVRLSWMVPLRALLTFAYLLLYLSVDLPWPAVQAVSVNLCSLGVTAVMEWRYRRTYSSPRLHAKQQALDAHVS